MVKMLNVQGELRNAFSILHGRQRTFKHRYINEAVTVGSLTLNEVKMCPDTEKFRISLAGSG